MIIPVIIYFILFYCYFSAHDFVHKLPFQHKANLILSALLSVGILLLLYIDSLFH